MSNTQLDNAIFFLSSMNDVLDEYYKNINRGFDAEYDKKWTGNELPIASIYYVCDAIGMPKTVDYPFDDHEFTPAVDRKQGIVRAISVLLSELVRMENEKKSSDTS